LLRRLQAQQVGRQFLSAKSIGIRFTLVTLVCPGVYKFEDLNGLEDIVDSPGVDSNLLAQQVSSLLCKAAEGVVDPAYKVLVKNFDPHKNTQAVVSTIKFLLETT